MPLYDCGGLKNSLLIMAFLTLDALAVCNIRIRVSADCRWIPICQPIFKPRTIAGPVVTESSLAEAYNLFHSHAKFGSNLLNCACLFRRQFHQLANLIEG